MTDTTAYDRFKQATGYDIKAFFEEFVNFSNTYYASIVTYYQGGEMVPEAFSQLDDMERKVKIIEPLFSLNKTVLDDISMWDILDDFTEVQTKIWTIKNSARWLRSVEVDNTNSIQITTRLSPNQTFEDMSYKRGDGNPEDDWLNIVTRQYIIEEDYTPENGSKNTFHVNFKNSGTNSVDSVIDTLSGKNVLGKDITTDFSIDNNDLRTIREEPCMVQALDIISTAMKGCIPEFPEYGLPNEFVGTTLNAIQYASLYKHLLNMFQRDSRWVSVELLNLKSENDAVFLEVKATSVGNQEFVQKIKI